MTAFTLPGADNAVAWLIAFLIWFNYAVFLYFVALNGFYVFLILLGYFGIRSDKQSAFLLDDEQMVQSPHIRPVSLVAPAYNEEATIAESVASLLQMRYPLYEIIVVNDGSTDRTLEVLTGSYEMVPGFVLYRHRLECAKIRGIYVSAKYPRLIVVDKENAGSKADAANAGINVSRYPLFCLVDADSLLEKDALLKTVRPFFEDPTTLCVGGTVRVVNNCVVEGGEVTEVRAPRGWLANCQAVEYLRAYLYGRVGWDQMGATLIISGAFGVFNKQAVIEAGGYDHNSLGEDFELVVRLRREAALKGQRYRVRFVSDTICWTEVPETLRVFKRQRSRWMRGLIQTLIRHRAMMFNPRYGLAGVLGMPFFFFFEMLGPVVEVVGFAVFLLCWVFGLLDWVFALWFLTVAILLGCVLSALSVVLMELTDRRYARLRDVFKLLAYALIDNLGYRQIHSFYRIIGIWEFLRGKKGWGTMTRTGFKKPTAS